MVYLPGCWKKTLNYYLTLLKKYWTLPTEKAIFCSLESLQILFLYSKTESCKKRKETFTSFFTNFKFVKIGEDFVVESFVKPAVVKMINSNQFETTNMVHALQLCYTYGINKLTETALLYRLCCLTSKKLLIDNCILVDKQVSFDIQHSIIEWIVDFLKDRKQRVKLSQDCFSEWGTVAAGVHQGTKLDQWLSLIMINNLYVASTNVWKYLMTPQYPRTYGNTKQANYTHVWMN